jgi:DNA-binding NtrC family response regulator
MPAALSMNNGPKARCQAAPEADRADIPIVLVVEDDSRTIHFIVTLLKYASPARVIEASNPQSALSAASAIGRPIDLLISDVDLSADQTGIDLARELAAEHESMRVVLMSARDLPPGELPPQWRFLAKPLGIAALLDCMNEFGIPVSTQWP